MFDNEAALCHPTLIVPIAPTAVFQGIPWVFLAMFLLVCCSGSVSNAHQDYP